MTEVKKREGTKFVQAIPPLPTSWPTDKLARVNLVSGMVIATHPQRTPLQLVDGKWEDVKAVA